MSLINLFSRLSFRSSVVCPLGSRSFYTDKYLPFWTTPCLLAEPLKKKKRIDPAIIKAREERRKKRLEKQIRRLEKNARQLKPIEECEIPLVLINEKKERQRQVGTINVEELEKRVLLEKKWALYKKEQHLKDLKMLDRIAYSQQKALDELRNVSEELYQEAIQIDFHLIPFESVGPVSTPAIENYDTPDGDYQDISKKWD
ncbi:Mitochondrial ribosomal protein L28 [Popillia japonica]|uniref:Large ribosomal subunit protein mL40 n=1 Tax=Popillia japonica TaxID=7064 RepID=A0AAW1N214_POPJA